MQHSHWHCSNFGPLKGTDQTAPCECAFGWTLPMVPENWALSCPYAGTDTVLLAAWETSVLETEASLGLQIRRTLDYSLRLK